ncbi:MAG: hypothetical protein EXR60_02000 [Dehalococcoidia bacterium]|nr:hypothetical protein [Dehalococcoidia bacterium]
MEAAALVVLGAIMFAHAWQLLRFTDMRLVGMIAGVGAVFLALLVFWSPLERAATMADPSATAIFVLLAAIYAASLAAVGLWGFDPRTLGFYSLFLAVGSVLLLLHFLSVPEEGEEISRSVLLSISSVIQVVLFALLFFHLAPPFRRMQTLTGWFFLVGSILLAVFGIGIPVGLWGDDLIGHLPK